jgi:hypothetical protein
MGIHLSMSYREVSMGDDLRDLRPKSYDFHPGTREEAVWIMDQYGGQEAFKRPSYSDSYVHGKTSDGAKVCIFEPHDFTPPRETFFEQIGVAKLKSSGVPEPAGDPS